jgi:hypothetical protein
VIHCLKRMKRYRAVEGKARDAASNRCRTSGDNPGLCENLPFVVDYGTPTRRLRKWRYSEGQAGAAGLVEYRHSDDSVAHGNWPAGTTKGGNIGVLVPAGRTRSGHNSDSAIVETLVRTASESSHAAARSLWYSAFHGYCLHMRPDCTADGGS